MARKKKTEPVDLTSTDETWDLLKPPEIVERTAPNQTYPAEIKFAARALYASGLPQSQIARHLGIEREQTVGDWRAANIPDDGKSWDEAKKEVQQEAARRTEEAAVDRIARTNEQSLTILGMAMGSLVVHLRAKVVYTEDGTPVAMPAIEPKSLEGIIHSACEIIREQRTILGEPTQTLAITAGQRGPTAGLTPEEVDAALGMFMRLAGRDGRIDFDETDALPDALPEDDGPPVSALPEA
jgi:transposase-like protein